MVNASFAPRHRRKVSFVLAATEHGTLIVNRLDRRRITDGNVSGVGHQIMEAAAFDPEEVDLALWVLEARRHVHGPGVVAIDCGANIGVHTIEWARRMTRWGWVIAIEAQERLFYALAGNIALNNCLNARAIHAVVHARDGSMRTPVPDYRIESSFSSLEMVERADAEDIGQPIRRNRANTALTRTMRIDSLRIRRLDLLKLDVEGMEVEALDGASDRIGRGRPVILAEWIKTGADRLRSRLETFGYDVFDAGNNLLALHRDDPVRRLVHRQAPGADRLGFRLDPVPAAARVGSPGTELEFAL